MVPTHFITNAKVRHYQNSLNSHRKPLHPNTGKPDSLYGRGHIGGLAKFVTGDATVFAGVVVSLRNARRNRAFQQVFRREVLLCSLTNRCRLLALLVRHGAFDVF